MFTESHTAHLRVPSPHECCVGTITEQSVILTILKHKLQYYEESQLVHWTCDSHVQWNQLALMQWPVRPGDVFTESHWDGVHALGH